MTGHAVDEDRASRQHRREARGAAHRLSEHVPEGARLDGEHGDPLCCGTSSSEEVDLDDSRLIGHGASVGHHRRLGPPALPVTDLGSRAWT